ncbi:MAG TPA: hypothetical protein VGH74_19925, partial [Planctomycetaceae bacterium]
GDRARHNSDAANRRSPGRSVCTGLMHRPDAPVCWSSEFFCVSLGILETSLQEIETMKRRRARRRERDL